MSQTWPVAVRLPSMSETFLPRTRLRLMLLLLGCLKATLVPAAIEKLCQLRIDLSEVVIVVVLPLVATLAWPAATERPLSWARAGVACSVLAATSAVVVSNASRYQRSVDPSM